MAGMIVGSALGVPTLSTGSDGGCQSGWGSSISRLLKKAHLR